MSTQYEFTADQNKQVGALASSMSFVGLFSTIFGVIGILITLVVVGLIFQDKVPAKWKEETHKILEKGRAQLPEKEREIAKEYNFDNLPKNNLIGIAVYSGVTGLFFVLLGIWTRTAGASFQKIVATQGSDITNLMNALDSLRAMYGLLYTLLVLALLSGVVAIGLTVYQNYIAK